MAAGVLEIVLGYVLSKTAIMSFGVRRDLRVYHKQPIQLRNNARVGQYLFTFYVEIFVILEIS